MGMPVFVMFILIKNKETPPQQKQKKTRKNGLKAKNFKSCFISQFISFYSFFKGSALFQLFYSLYPFFCVWRFNLLR